MPLVEFISLKVDVFSVDILQIYMVIIRHLNQISEYLIITMRYLSN